MNADTRSGVLQMNAARIFVSTMLALTATSTHAATLQCDQVHIQAVAPHDTTIVRATRLQSPAAYCSVVGYVTSTNPGPNNINFELDLPDQWAGRFYFGGNGGAAGSIQDPPVQYVQRGFAATATDTGHQGSVIDFSSFYNNPAKKLDYGNRAIHLVAVATQQITKAYYRNPRMVRYYRGCSKGGQQGLTQAQEYPDDFEGVIAGASGSGIQFPALVRYAQRVGASADNFISAAKLQLINDAVVKACDANDGVSDGIVNPELCSFNPAVLKCSPGQDPASCLTASELGTAQAILSPTRTTSGRFIYPPYSIADAELGWPTLIGFAPANAPGTANPWLPPVIPPLGYIFANPSAQSLFYDDLTYNAMTDFKFTDAYIQQFETLSRTKIGNVADNPNLSVFARKGAKLLMWHGFSDPLVSPYNSIEYYESVVDFFHGSLPRVRNFARLFMAPGVLHCGGGPGPQDTGDHALDAMIRWVEHNKAPDELVATSTDSTTGAVREFKLCPYPQVAIFKNRKHKSRDINDADSYECRSPFFALIDRPKFEND